MSSQSIDIPNYELNGDVLSQYPLFIVKVHFIFASVVSSQLSTSA